MAILNEERVKQIIADDAFETKALKAAANLAQKEAHEARVRYNFLVAHTGTEGATRGAVFFDCEANWSVLYSYMNRNGLSTVNFDDMCTAFATIKDSLATDATAGHVEVVSVVRTTPELRRDHIGEVARVQTNSSMPNYERKTSTVSPRGQVRLPRLPEPSVHLDLTKQEIIAMPPAKLKMMLAKGGKSTLDEVNRILQGR
jgi:hypothetical protein